MRQFGLPTLVALALDATFDLLDGRGGGGGGGGRGRNRGPGQGSRRAQLSRYLKAAREADPETFIAPVERSIDAATARLQERHPDADPGMLRDAAVIAGVSVTMIGIRWLRVLPGLPFAPGHKNAVLLPLYLLGAELTHSRLGGAACGLVMGLVAFVSGEGRYGVLEVVKHLVPGLLADLLLPLLKRLPGRPVWAYGVAGVVMATGRMSAELLAALLLGAPGAFYAWIGTLAVTHLGAGAASGFISAALLRALDRVRCRLGQSSAVRIGPEEHAALEDG